MQYAQVLGEFYVFDQILDYKIKDTHQGKFLYEMKSPKVQIAGHSYFTVYTFIGINEVIKMSLDSILCE